MTLVLDLLENAGLLLAVCFTYRFIAARWPDDRLHRESGAGVLFGAAAAIAMSMAVAVPGVGIFDARTVVLSLGALYGGPVTAALAGGLAGGSRIYLGGETAAIVVGVLVGLFVSMAFPMAGAVLLSVLAVDVLILSRLPALRHRLT